MLRYARRRLIQSVAVLVGVTLVVFAILHLVPGDPVRVGLGPRFDPAAYTALRHAAGLDRPLVVQYVSYVGHALTGNFGVSFGTGQPVTQILEERIPATLALALGALLIALVISVPLGVLAAARHGKWTDTAARVFSQLGVSVPDFWIGILLILFFAGRVRWLPPSGYVPISQDPAQWLQHLLLPALTVGLVTASILTRFIRAAVLEELGQDYVRTADAKGVAGARLITRHVLRNAMAPIITVSGVQLATLLGGVIVVEVLFAWPGLGQLTYQAVEQRDYPVLQGAVLLIAGVFLVVNLLVDLLHALLDPRITLR